MEGSQWGRPGPGGRYWRDSAITGQGFFDKMVNTDRSSVSIMINRAVAVGRMHAANELIGALSANLIRWKSVNR